MADEQHPDLPTGTDAPPEALRAVDALLDRAPHPETPAAPFADLAELDELRTALEAEREAHRRTAADFTNFRRRTTEERERDAGAAASDLLLRLLGVIDDLDRAIADSAAHGLVKVLTVPGKDKILGATIAGEHAGDLITEFVSAMKHGIGLNKILGTIHIYPTLAEANKYVAGNWKRNHAPKGLLEWVEKFHAWRRG